MWNACVDQGKQHQFAVSYQNYEICQRETLVAAVV